MLLPSPPSAASEATIGAAAPDSTRAPGPNSARAGVRHARVDSAACVPGAFSDDTGPFQERGAGGVHAVDLAADPLVGDRVEGRQENAGKLRADATGRVIVRIPGRDHGHARAVVRNGHVHSQDEARQRRPAFHRSVRMHHGHGWVHDGLTGVETTVAAEHRVDGVHQPALVHHQHAVPARQGFHLVGDARRESLKVASLRRLESRRGGAAGNGSVRFDGQDLRRAETADFETRTIDHHTAQIAVQGDGTNRGAASRR